MTCEPLPLDVAFLGRKLAQLEALHDLQVQTIFDAQGLAIPIRACSIIMVLDQDGPQSLLQIARRLELPHQLVAQRANMLLDRQLITRTSDPIDRRKSNFELTAFGEAQLVLLKSYCQNIERVYEELFTSVGVQLDEVLLTVTNALKRESLLIRLEKLGLITEGGGTGIEPISAATVR